MKTRMLLSVISVTVATFFFAACGGDTDTVVAPPPVDEEAPEQEEAPPPETSAQEAPTEEAAASEAQEAITITGNDQMKFSMTEFTVAAGSEVEIVFKNVGQLPKESMGHNLLIVTQGTDPIQFATASAAFPQNDYVAPELEDQIIVGTRILGPGESETLTFTAPSEPGEYPFLCSFPGHAAAGMRGTMIVE